VPAATEASYAGVPLLLVTADRPPELRATGANQTVDQLALLAPLVRLGLDLGAPEPRLGAVAMWRSAVARAVAVADDPAVPGPVHLNLPFRDPLVPDGDDTWVEPLDGRSDPDSAPRPWTADLRRRPAAAPALELVLADVGAVVSDRIPARGVVVVGDGVDEEVVAQVLALAAATGWPVLSEPSGNARRGPQAVAHGCLLFADPDVAASLVPEVVLAVGRVGLARPVTALLRAARSLLVVAVPGVDRWSDPTRTADAVLAQVPWLDEGVPVDSDPDWPAAWRSADAAAAARLEVVLASAEGLTGLEVARTLWDAVPAESLLLVAASRPVRDLEAVARVREDAPWVIGNRGTSGIDGLVSTAWGAALGHARRTGAPSYALLGDLAFLYDLTGLSVAAGEPEPDLVVVVSDNDGGGLFTSLEQGAPEHATHFDRVFGTPQGRDLVAAAAALGRPAERVTTRAGLVAALERAAAAGGVRVVVADTGDRRTEASVQHAVRRP